MSSLWYITQHVIFEVKYAIKNQRMNERMNEMESDERTNEIESYVLKSWIAYITLHIKISVIYHKYKADREDKI